MKLCIAGGQLQGIEAIYLAKKAGYETILIDKNENAPGAWLADESFILNITKDYKEVKKILNDVDAVLPTNENKKALIHLEKLCRKAYVPYMQDNNAFWITSDKLIAYKCLKECNISQPKNWPESAFPVIVKPACRSGSEAIYRVNNHIQLERAVKKVLKVDDRYIVQEFVTGPALSLEVIAEKGVSTPLQITQLEFDDSYCCKRVFTPANVDKDIQLRITEVGKIVSEKLSLTGITDIQALINGGIPKVNEINARLPSQTPTVVYHSSGINMVELLSELFLRDRLPKTRVLLKEAVIYQHIMIKKNTLLVIGEHILSTSKHLKIKNNFYESSDSITNITSEDDPNGCVATLIVKGRSLKEAKQRMNKVIGNIMESFHLNNFVDSSLERRQSSND